MHHAAFDWVRQQVHEYGPFDGTVVEFGSHDINGGVRELFDSADEYIGVDSNPGLGVDVVMDAVVFAEKNRYGARDGRQVQASCVVSTEVFEHTRRWKLMVEAAWQLLAAGGMFVCTAAGPGRAPHSMYGGPSLRDGEWYENVDPDELLTVMDRWFDLVVVDVRGTDVRAVGFKS